MIESCASYVGIDYIRPIQGIDDTKFEVVKLIRAPIFGVENIFANVKLLKKHIKLPILCPLIAMEEDEIKQKCKEIGI